MLVADRDFVDLFPSQGQPAASPARLALVTLLQFMEALTDRQAADAVRTRLDWKYLLCLELTDPGFTPRGTRYCAKRVSQPAPHARG